MRKIALPFMLTLCLVLFGCGKKADENKPVDQVQAEAQKMNVDQLKSAAMQYKDAILAKRADVEKIAAKLKEIPITDLLSEKTKSLKSEIDSLNKSLSALKERLDIYLAELKKKGGDTTSLQI